MPVIVDTGPHCQCLPLCAPIEDKEPIVQIVYFVTGAAGRHTIENDQENIWAVPPVTGVTKHHSATICTAAKVPYQRKKSNIDSNALDHRRAKMILYYIAITPETSRVL
jgi:hypothetical protein